METNSSRVFNRTLFFTRNHARNGVFSWPTVTYILKESEQGTEIGTLQMRYRKASFTAANSNEGFSLRKGFWGRSWYYVGDDEREFGSSSMGLNFRPSFTFADGSRYNLRAKRRLAFSRSRAGEPTQTASFMRDDMEVMLLQNFARMPFFSNEMTAPMEGTIGTNINELGIIAGLLLFYQGHIERRNRSAH